MFRLLRNPNILKLGELQLVMRLDVFSTPGIQWRESYVLFLGQQSPITML